MPNVIVGCYFNVSQRFVDIYHSARFDYEPVSKPLLKHLYTSFLDRLWQRIVSADEGTVSIIMYVIAISKNETVNRL